MIAEITTGGNSPNKFTGTTNSHAVDFRMQ